MTEASNEKPRPGEVQEDQADAERREVLTKIGRFIYAAPALTLLAQPKAAQAGYGRGGTWPGYGFGDKNHKHSRPFGLKKRKLVLKNKKFALKRQKKNKRKS